MLLYTPLKRKHKQGDKMKVVFRDNTNNADVWSNKPYRGNSLDETNLIVIPDSIEKDCYIKTSIGFQKVIVPITRVQALELIAGTCEGINLKM